MKRWLCGVVLTLSVVGGLTAADASRRPNVLVILTDDQGWGDLSLHGNTNLKTPRIDSLGKEGAQFAHFFVQPVCSPTRAEFLTGRYHPRGGVRGVSTGGERLNLDERTIAESFAAAGYATGLFGKWHNGTQYPYHPRARGFQEFYGFTSGHWGDYFDPPLDHNGQDVRGKGFLADDLTERARAFMTRDPDRPFFCYLAYNTPHSPMQVPDPYWDRFKSANLKLGPTGQQKEDVPHTRAALAMCENLDDNIGRILQTLEERKLADNTIVVFFCDNGPNGWRWNGGMKGRKGTTDEGGVRSPLLVRWSGRIRPGTVVTPIAGAIDLLPTLTDLAGIRRIGDRPLDGVSLAPALLGANMGAPTRSLFQHWGGRTSVRTQKYRLDADGRLFDMVSDPGQRTDIAAREPQTAAALKAEVAQWRNSVLAGMTPTDDRPYPVGHREFPRTTLPARDGVPHGTIQRSARAPNCSYFTHWTSREDRLTWNVDVATEGRYRVDLLMTCARENLGTVLAFGLGDGRVSRKVEDAHDPSPYGDGNDRVPRVGESLMKEFKTWPLGEVQLARGKDTLTLQATEIPGKQSIELRSVVLTLLP